MKNEQVMVINAGTWFSTTFGSDIKDRKLATRTSSKIDFDKILQVNIFQSSTIYVSIVSKDLRHSAPSVQ